MAVSAIFSSRVFSQTCYGPYNPTPATSWGIAEKSQSSAVIWNGATPTAADMDGDGISELIVTASDKSFWFYLLLLFIVSLISFAIYYYRKMENRKFLAFRLELGNELHDMIGTVSTKMIFAAENMMRQQKNHDPSLERIVEYSKVMNSSFRDALWSIYYNTDRLDNLVTRIIEIAFQSVESTNFNLKVDKQEHIPNFNLSPLQKLNILMILRESLHNVLKHSSGDQVTLVIEVKNRYFYLVVSDNGKGPVSLKIEKGYGIRSMRQRASRINGDLNFIINESSFSVELTIR